MPVTSEFLDLVRSRGVNVHEMPGWQSRGETDGPFSINGVILHHDAEGLNNDNVPNYMSQDGVSGAQLWIKFDGTLYVLAAGRKWHAGLGSGFRNIPANNGNSVCVGIETDYSGSGPRDPRIDATIHIVTRCLVEHYGLDPQRDLALHKEYAPDRKIDLANFDAENWRNKAGQPFGGKPPIVTPPTKTPAQIEEEELMSAKDEIVSELKAYIDQKLTVTSSVTGAKYPAAAMLGFLDWNGTLESDLIKAIAAKVGAVATPRTAKTGTAAKPPVVAKPAPATKTTVGAGEGFDAIARRLHVTPDQLAAANPQIKNRDVIGVGDSINIPKA